MTLKQSIQEDNLTRKQEGLTGRRNHRNLTKLEADIKKDDLTKRQEEGLTGR